MTTDGCPGAPEAEKIYAAMVSHHKHCEVCTDDTFCGVARRAITRIDALVSQCRARGCTEDTCLREV